MTAQDIKDACHKVLANPEYKPHDGITYCNLALYDILVALGYDKWAYDFEAQRPMLANDIAEKAQCTLTEMSATDAAAAALDGVVVIACLKTPEHGHVCAVYPFSSMVHSHKWDCDVPVVANVGKDVGVMGANYAFGAKPRYFRMSL